MLLQILGALTHQSLCDFSPAVQKAAVPARLAEPTESPSPRGHQLLNKLSSFGILILSGISSFSSQVMQCELSFEPFWFIFMGVFLGDPPQEGRAQLCSHIQGKCLSLDGLEEESTEC